MPEWVLELRELFWDANFIPLGMGLLIVLTVGTGLWNTRWRRTVWLVGVALMGMTLYLGLARHEWGEVLFNGQLL
ncbi:hypothetical protein [Deferrisoma palaeochoriense]